MLKGRKSLTGSVGQIRCLPQPDSCMGFEPGPSKEGSWMMAQNGLVVAGIDIAKDKADVSIRALSNDKRSRAPRRDVGS